MSTIPFQVIDWNSLVKTESIGTTGTDGTSFLIKEGMTYIVSDDLSTHRSVTSEGVKLLIIDGDFLKLSHE